ncbi:MAG: putative metal-binding motif-containing protein [Anaeromyxobacter sp.]|nr:putative metal-binding motif-containing protein [Anaeromyxobacter sp.]MBL0278578.1 putative metal-binding motif-containing protein [Anaeromyxobacter sp.]
MKPTVAMLALAGLASACGGSSSPVAPPTVCTAAETRTCYSGPAGTEGVGACLAGTQVCAADGATFGACLAEVLPSADVCGNGVDDDCDGAVDDSLDADADGWAACDGDCDDTRIEINPGAYDVPGTGVDEDCSGTPDDAATACSAGPKLGGATGSDLAQALDLCQATTQGPPLAERRWGLISARLTLADGTGAPADLQVGVLDGFGLNAHNAPRAGATLVALSSGTARDVQDAGWLSPFGAGFATANQSQAPGDLLAAHGNAVPHAVSCPGHVGTTVFDPVRLELLVRAPTNAQGLRFKFRFYSSDFPANACTEFNDLFVAQLTSGAAGIPADRSVALAPNGDPITVNDGLITTCADSTGVPGPGCVASPQDLNGSGYHLLVQGGATSWLETSAPVVGGETLTLAFNVWDTGDHSFDSLVLVDGFEWLFTPTTLSTLPAP